MLFFCLFVYSYRDFPLLQEWEAPVTGPRAYMYNFMGTVYPDSSRQTLLQLLNSTEFTKYRDRGLVKARIQSVK